MSTSTRTPQSPPLCVGTSQYNMSSLAGLSMSHEEPHLTDASTASSNELRYLDFQQPTSEHSEASIEASVEPCIFTGVTHLEHPCSKINNVKVENLYTYAPLPPPLSLNTNISSSASSPSGKNQSTPESGSPTSRTPKSRRHTAIPKNPGEKERGSIKRGISGFFKNFSHHGYISDPEFVSQIDGTVLSTNTNGSAPSLMGGDQGRMSLRSKSGGDSNSTTRSNTPSAPGSPNTDGRNPPHVRLQEPSAETFLARSRDKAPTMTSTFRGKFHRPKQTTHTSEETMKDSRQRHRSSSVDLNTQIAALAHPQKPDALLPERQIWGMVADAGTGLKARRLSMNLPDDFAVDVADLYTEYCDQSKLLGRRGKSIGKGATASVKLMNKKGGYPGEVYAVKKFRGKAASEVEDEYEKKVKSEFSIAKSAHHPNIVETYRLCRHNGHWNQVMEFCDQGDLFGLVSQKYLNREDHFQDRVCLFKQLVQGLNYLHSHGIAHRDVKLENLLITRNSKLKITDFGVSEVFAGIHPGLRSAGGECGRCMGDIRLCAPGMCGSPPYVAPEVIAKDGEYDPRPLDVWGAAIVMLCMCAGGVLWSEAKAGSSPRYDELVRGWDKWNLKHADNGDACMTDTDYPCVGFFDKHINPPALRRVLLMMLNPEPSKRATMPAIARNRWLKAQDCCQIDSYEDPTTIIDASKTVNPQKSRARVVQHNHLPPHAHHGHKLVRLPGSTNM